MTEKNPESYKGSKIFFSTIFKYCYHTYRAIRAKRKNITYPLPPKMISQKSVGSFFLMRSLRLRMVPGVVCPM